jgi:peptide/nickel transport system substrate-binding protein
MSPKLIAALCLPFLALPGHAEDRVLRWTSQGDALTLDPHAQNEAPTIGMAGSIYERLVNRDPALNLVPELATGWTVIAPDTWEFALRPGVTFHGGEAFTADDVVFSVERAKAESSGFKDQVASIARVEAVDDLTVRIVTLAPNPILPNELTSLFIMDRGWAEANGVAVPQDFAAGEQTFAVLNANGTGPFTLESRAPDELTVLTRNDAWWGWAERPGNVTRIEYRPIKNAATRVAALLSGEVDFLLDPPVQDIPRIAAAEGLVTETVAQIRTIFLGMDVASAELRSTGISGSNPFADLRVRQAVSLAIDRQTIRDVIMQGQSFPAGITTSPGVAGYSAELDAAGAIFDPEKARRLLAEAGLAAGFAVRLDCPNDRYINDGPICEAVAAMLARVGIRAMPEAVSKAQHFPKVLDKLTDFYLLGWGVPTLDSHYVFQALYESAGAWNATGFSNPRMNELTARMAGEVDPAERAAMLAEAWAIAAAELPYAPIHHQVLTWATSSRLHLPIAADDIARFAYAVID